MSMRKDFAVSATPSLKRSRKESEVAGEAGSWVEFGAGSPLNLRVTSASRHEKLKGGRTDRA